MQPASSPRDTMRIRAVHRAMGELRRGVPVVLRGESPLVVMAAETAGAPGLADMAALSAGPAQILLAPVRAAALLRRPIEPGTQAVALLAGQLFDPAILHGLADPTAAQLLRDPPERTAAPVHAPAALALAKAARLLPAMLAAPLRREGRQLQEARFLLSVEAGDILALPDEEAARLVRVAEAHIPMEDAPDARLVSFRAPDGGIEHMAILVGQPEHVPAPLTRLHSECFTGDLLASLRCDCGPQLRSALRRMAAEGAGVLLYLAQEGRGIGLANKLRAYALQDRGLDTVDANRALGWNADERNFLVAATMLQQLGIARIRLLTNNPDKVASLSAHGIAVEARVPLFVEPNGVNDHYLATKARRFGHLIG